MGNIYPVELLKPQIEEKSYDLDNLTQYLDEKVEYLKTNKHKNKEEHLDLILSNYNKRMSVYGTTIIDHVCMKNNINPFISITNKDSSLNNETILNIIKECDQFYDDFESTVNYKGIILKENNKYIDYCPFILQQFNEESIDQFDNFSLAIDNYYSHYDSNKIDKDMEISQVKITQKVDKIKQDQSNRIKELHTKILNNEMKAKLIENNVELVDVTINIIRSYLAKSLQWEAIERAVEREKELENPVAKCIKCLNLDRNCFTIELLTFDNETGLVEIDITQNAFKNAEMYYVKAKEDKTKMDKTMIASEKLQKKAEKEANKELELLTNQVPVFREIRKAEWFEKFHWFISSENYLVICGRDSIQNELIVKKYMKAYDIFVYILLLYKNIDTFRCSWFCKYISY